MRIVVALALAICSAAAQAQEGTIHLRLNPRAGDTLHTWLEQHTEVSMLLPGNAVAASRSATTTLSIHSRTIVRATQPTNSTVITIVDSAMVSSTDPQSSSMNAAAEKALKGQRLELRLGIDGTVESAKDARGVTIPRDVAETMAAMPAVFPKKPVAIGQQWTREMPLPSGGPLGTKGSGHVTATFKLDSLQKGGAIAYISMRGEIRPDSAKQGMEVSGSIAGTMQLDRIRGWMTDSRFVVTLKSAVVPPLGTGIAPMKFLTKVTQRLRTMDNR